MKIEEKRGLMILFALLVISEAFNSTGKLMIGGMLIFLTLISE